MFRPPRSLAPVALLWSATATATVPLADWRGESDQSNAQYGWSVASAGDVDGDGFDDVIVGALAYTNGQFWEGAAALYHGSAAGLAALPGWALEGNRATAYFGGSVSGAGDINGDGFDDVIVGASGYHNGNQDEGAAFLYLGSVLGLASSPSWSAYGNQREAFFGHRVAPAGDVNGDGFDDVVVGAYGYDQTAVDEGAAALYLGSAGGLAPTPAWTAFGGQAGAAFGWPVASAGDVNGDGFDDVIVGAQAYSNGQVSEGAAFLYYGSAAGLAPAPGWSAESNQANALFGNAAAGAGDVDGDGFDDAIVGAPGYDHGDFDEGAAALFYGSAAGLQSAPSWLGERDRYYAAYGNAVSSAGDVNADGYSDVVVGAHGMEAAFLYLGSPVGLQATADLTVQNTQMGAMFGYPVASAGDVNGDGRNDVVIGANRYSHGELEEGGAFLYLGH